MKLQLRELKAARLTMLLKASGLARAYFRFWLASSFPTSSSPFSLSPSPPPSPLSSHRYSFSFLFSSSFYSVSFSHLSLPCSPSLPSSLFFSPFFSPPRVSLYLCRSYLVPWESARAIRTARATEREQVLSLVLRSSFLLLHLDNRPLAHHWSRTLPASDRFLRLSNVR